MGWIPRQYPRFKTALPIELRPKGVSAPMRTQTSDISLGGCYVELAFTQELSTPVEMTLWIGQSKVVIHAEVVSKHPAFGNGLKFVRLTKQGRETLDRYLGSLQPQGRTMQESPILGVASARK